MHNQTKSFQHEASASNLSSIKASPFVVWAGEPLARIYEDTVPTKNAVSKPLELSCARNEFEGCIFAVRANQPVHELRLHSSDLSSEKGQISKENIRLSFVGSVPVPKNTGVTPPEELERKAPFKAPDPILDTDRMDIKKDETQPCYFLVYVPKNAEPGDYYGQIKVSSVEGEGFLPVVLHVYPIVLPEEKSLCVTNWFNLERIASASKVKIWSEDFWKALDIWIGFMTKYSQNVFWVPLDTIKILQENEGYRFDFTLFDKYVEILMKHNAKGIEIMHVARFKQWGGAELNLKDFKVTDLKGQERTEPGAEVLPHLLPSLEKHLEEKGWLDKSLIHIADEPTEDGLPAWTAVSSMVHRYAPRIRRIDAVETVGFEGLLEVWVPTLQHFDNWMDHYLKAVKEGYELWFYTCLNPKGRYPNRFLDYSLTKTRILHWINYAYGLTGFLHWGFNWWQENDPFGEPNPNLPPGDSHISYPGEHGPLPSLRLEAMRDGLEDYEYLKLLENGIMNVKKQLGEKARCLPFERRALEICRRVVPSLTGYARDPSVLLKAREAVVNEIMEARRKPLALVLTEPPEWKPVVKGAVTVIVKGVCEEGVHVEVNGKKLTPRNGYFSTYTYPDENGEVVVKVSENGVEKVITRRFEVVV